MQDDEIDQESIIGFMTFNCQAARLKWNVCRERISMEVYMVVCSRTCDFLGNKLGRSATERSSPLCNRRVGLGHISYRHEFVVSPNSRSPYMLRTCPDALAKGDYKIGIYRRANRQRSEQDSYSVMSLFRPKDSGPL